MAARFVRRFLSSRRVAAAAMRAIDAAARAIAAMLVRAYQIFFGWMFFGSCRFSPTCSDYAREALAAHSFFRALYLIVRRLSRCHPFCGGGPDPVPPPRSSLRKPSINGQQSAK